MKKALSKGFTLIETLIYIALLAVILGGFLEVAFEVIQNNERLSHENILVFETDFLLRKIEYFLGTTSAITKPALGSSGSSLSFRENSVSSTMRFDADEKKIFLKTGSGPEEALSGSAIEVDDLTFTYIAQNGKKNMKVELIIEGNSYPLIHSFP